MPRMPRFFAMPTSRSPVTEVAVKPSVAATRMSPGCAVASAANKARLSAGPHWQVRATPTSTDAAGASGLMR